MSGGFVPLTSGDAFEEVKSEATPAGYGGAKPEEVSGGKSRHQGARECGLFVDVE